MGLSVVMTLNGNSVTTYLYTTQNTNISGISPFGKPVKSTGEVRQYAKAGNVPDSDVNGTIQLSYAFKIPERNFTQNYYFIKNYSGMSGVQRMATEGRSLITKLNSVNTQEIAKINSQTLLARRVNSKYSQLQSYMKGWSIPDRFTQPLVVTTPMKEYTVRASTATSYIKDLIALCQQDSKFKSVTQKLTQAQNLLRINKVKEASQSIFAISSTLETLTGSSEMVFRNEIDKLMRQQASINGFSLVQKISM